MAYARKAKLKAAEHDGRAAGRDARGDQADMKRRAKAVPSPGAVRGSRNRNMPSIVRSATTRAIRSRWAMPAGDHQGFACLAQQGSGLSVERGPARPDVGLSVVRQAARARRTRSTAVRKATRSHRPARQQDIHHGMTIRRDDNECGQVGLHRHRHRAPRRSIARTPVTDFRPNIRSRHHPPPLRPSPGP